MKHDHVECVRRLRRIIGVESEECRWPGCELFSLVRVNRQIEKSNMRHLKAGANCYFIVDTSTSESWDFLKASHRRLYRQRPEPEEPRLVSGSPPCTAFNVIQNLNRGRTDAQKHKRTMTEATVLFIFVLSVYLWQARRCR